MAVRSEYFMYSGLRYLGHVYTIDTQEMFIYQTNLVVMLKEGWDGDIIVGKVRVVTIGESKGPFVHLFCNWAWVWIRKNVQRVWLTRKEPQTRRSHWFTARKLSSTSGLQTMRYSTLREAAPLGFWRVWVTVKLFWSQIHLPVTANIYSLLHVVPPQSTVAVTTAKGRRIKLCYHHTGTIIALTAPLALVYYLSKTTSTATIITLPASQFINTNSKFLMQLN